MYLISAVHRLIECFCLSPLEIEPVHVVLAAVREKELVLPGIYHLIRKMFRVAH